MDLVFLLLAIVSLCIGTLLLYNGIDYCNVFIGGIGVLFLILTLMLCHDGLSIITNEQEVQKTVSEIKENTKDWTYFLDGQEVSFENIDLDQYNISYDKGKNKVFLSKK